MHRKYTGEDFDEDLRTVLRRSGCKNEKIAFIMDESNVLDSGFLERMNTLLANGEVKAAAVMTCSLHSPSTENVFSHKHVTTVHRFLVCLRVMNMLH